MFIIENKSNSNNYYEISDYNYDKKNSPGNSSNRDADYGS